MRSRPLKGSNLTTVKGINEKLILHLLRIHGNLTKAEATRITGLSANAISVIFRSLEREGLLLRGEPIRGRIGQPSVPMRLNPDVGHFIGLKVGRRSHDLVLVNFVGDVLAAVSSQHDYPTPDETVQFVNDQLPFLLHKAGVNESDIAALNIATPFELWSWTSNFDAPLEEMNAWRNVDLAQALREQVPWPVALENDGTAACRAELTFGPAVEVQDLVYFFVGTFIGGGIVLNGSVYPGRRGSSGGFGPLRIPDEPGGDRLVDHASLVVLEQMLSQHDSHARLPKSGDRAEWLALEPVLTEWLDRAGRSLGQAIVSALAILDFEMIVIDGAFPAFIRDRLVEAVDRHFDELDQQGVVRLSIQPGHFGYLARAMGAAAYQISTDYMIDQNTLLHESASPIPRP